MPKSFLSPALAMAIAATLTSATDAAANVGGNLLPRHGDVVTVHQTTLLNPFEKNGDDGQAPEGNVVWDFSQSEIIDANIEWRYLNYADTLFMEIRPHIRRDYAVKGDTINLICTEIWCRRIGAEGNAAPYNYVGGDTTTPVSFDERGRQHQCDSIWGDAVGLVDKPVTGTLILPDGVTIEGATMTRRRYVSVRSMGAADHPRDTTDANPSWLHSEELITWQAPGLRYDVAETRVNIDSIPGQPATGSWESYICPPETQPLESADQNYVFTPADGSQRYGRNTPSLATAPGDSDSPADPWLDDDVISATVNSQGIALGGTAPADGKVGFLLCDIMGRVYAQLPTRSYTEGESVDTTIPRPSGLQPGDYLLRIVTPNGTATRKLILR